MTNRATPEDHPRILSVSISADWIQELPFVVEVFAELEWFWEVSLWSVYSTSQQAFDLVRLSLILINCNFSLVGCLNWRLCVLHKDPLYSYLHGISSSSWSHYIACDYSFIFPWEPRSLRIFLLINHDITALLQPAFDISVFVFVYR